MSWQLWRQDDNGRRFLVDTCETRDQAEVRMIELTRSRHKQTYWVSEDTSRGADAGSEEESENGRGE